MKIGDKRQMHICGTTHFTLERYIALMQLCIHTADNLQTTHSDSPQIRGAFFLAAVVGFLALLTACAVPPVITVTAIDVVEVGKNSNEVAIRLQLSNPTNVPIRIDTWKYSIQVRNQQVYTGEWIAAITVPPESRLLTAIPAVVPASSQPGPDSPWTVDGTLQYLETTRFSQLLYDLGLKRPKAIFSSSGTGMGSGGSIPSAG